MLTPPFDVTQDDDFVVVHLRIPFAKLEDMDFYIDGTNFKFYMRPYFLQLCFPARLVENGAEKAVYNRETNGLDVFLPKETKGQVFPNLDLPTTLRPVRTAKSQLIEVLSSENGTSGDGFCVANGRKLRLLCPTAGSCTVDRAVLRSTGGAMDCFEGCPSR